MSGHQTDTKTETKVNTKIQFPSRYQVIIHNDEFTPMEFVIQLLIEIFNKNIEEAKDITMTIHTEGQCEAGVYSFEIAEQKVNECAVICSYHGHPLKVTMEKI